MAKKMKKLFSMMLVLSMVMSIVANAAGEVICGDTEHLHDDTCKELLCPVEVGTMELKCTEEHEHTEECPAAAAHVHGSTCYGELNCGYIAEHSHDENCYAAELSDEPWYSADTYADTAEFTIDTVAELQEFAKLTQSGVNFKNKTVKLGANIDLAGTYWYQRDAEGNVVADYRITDFAGAFDGCGYIVSNINLRNDYDSGNVVGLCFFRSVTGSVKNLTLNGIDADCVGHASFYALANSFQHSDSDCAVKNVHVKNVDVYIDNDECTGSNYSQVAGMIRYFGKGTIAEDCTVSNLNATVTGNAAAGGFSVFVAQRSWFYDCDVSNITLNIGDVDYGCGGFAAYVQSSSYVQRVFDDCDASNVNITVGYLDTMVGGFLGTLGGMVNCDDCDVTGKITVLSDVDGAHAGGFTGNLGWQGDWSSDKIGHTFDNCTADVDITAVNSDVGGFVGLSAITDDLVLDQDEAFLAVFTNCTARGDVTTTNGAAGGFVGAGDRGHYVSCTAAGAARGNVAGGFWGEVFSMPAAPANGNTGKGEDCGIKIVNSTATAKYYGETEGSLVAVLDLMDDSTEYVTPYLAENNTVFEKVTVTYTDGVEDEEVFADQVYTHQAIGDETPAFDGTPTREGYTFTGWSPEVADTVSADAVYAAQWEEAASPSRPSRPVVVRPVVTPEEELDDSDVPMEETPVEEEEIVEEETPVEEEEIFDEDLPLADVPETGDMTALWAAASVVSAAGVLFLGKKNKDEE